MKNAIIAPYEVWSLKKGDITKCAECLSKKLAECLIIVYRIIDAKEKIYRKINFIISFFCLKIITPITKKGTIYHNLVNNILKDTRGWTEVIEVINIQNIYDNNNKNVEFLNRGLNRWKLYTIYINDKNKRPNKSGSVGKAISTPIERPRSFNDIEKGVSKTIK